ncbi:phosphotransferase family protein [Haladaptatus cibarius]|uniref:phosphotransferase family protein n=1 Tax=Haladaptatus cibarius TaxID=453847 RepID=UPI000678D314|nr:phosphotransferase [Haladaptatus cibarius]
MTGTSPDVEVVPRMVEEILDGRQVVDVTAAEEGTDDVFFVTVEMPNTSRECVLKARSFVNPPAFRVEPRVIDFVSRRTEIPVPDVFGYVDDHDDLPAPFFLMGRAPGEQISGPESLTDDALERTARDAGRHLGELHSSASFDGYGRLRAGVDVDSEPTVGDLAVADPAEELPSALRRSAEGGFERIEETRFSDMLGDLRAGLDTHLDAVPADSEPVLIHADYRFGNLLIDPETGAVRTVLDWGNPSTGHSEYDLVQTEQYLCGRLPLDADRRHLVRNALEAGYGETNDLSRDEGFDAVRRAYLFITQLWPLAWFDLWYGGDDEIAEQQRKLMRSLLP